VAKNGIDKRGLLESLSGMPNSRLDTHESLRFDARSIGEAIEHIKRLGGTGSLTVHFANGKANGLAEWRSRKA
jgi:hypothetical protein